MRPFSRTFAAFMTALLFVVSGLSQGQAVSSVYTSWPVNLDGPSGLIQVFQPQPEKLEGDKLTARAAVSLTSPGATEPVFGAIWITARVATERDARTVTILDLTVRRVRFPDSTDAQQTQFAQVLQQQIPNANVTFSLDQLMTSLDVAAKEKEAAQELQVTPPKIIFIAAPATLVVIDGQPRLQPTPDQPGLMRVVNTPFIILLDLNSKQYFLKAGEFWYSAPDAMGPWSNVGSIPANVGAEGAKLATPPPALDVNAPATPVNPGQIIVSEEPAELIFTLGPPTYIPLAGDDLLYVSNTESDVFLEVATQQTYVLLSGRWFTSRSLQGPWQYVASDKLPDSFARIAPDSPKAHVLSSIANTVAANEARLDAQVPQTAAVDRTAGQSLAVSYDGDPQFEAVAQSPVSYAVNTPEAVLLVNSRYYCCHQAVWYEGASAIGPWLVSVLVPEVIYTLPPSCPVYYVRYCYVYDSTPDRVYCGYLPGYTGCYVYGRTVVYGTGYSYHGWYRHDYYPRPYTWGFGVRYDPSVNAWGAGATYRYNRTWFVESGDYGDHHGWWGPRGYTDYHNLPRDNFRVNNVTEVNNVTNITNVTVRNTTINRLNIYNRTDNISRKVVVNRTNIVVNHNTSVRNETVHNETVHNEVRDNPVRVNNPPVNTREPAHVENNVYAGHDGQVYRRTNDGWQQHTNTGWQKSATIPEARPDEHVAPAHVEAPPKRVERPAEPAHVEHSLEPVHAAQPAHGDRPVEPAHVERPAEPEHVNRPVEPTHVERPAEPAHPARPAEPVHAERPVERPPVRAEHPAEGPSHPSTPAHSPGLEADHVARERGAQKTNGNDRSDSRH